MAKNVIILGAGASAQFGAPMMGNFSDVAQALYASNNVRDFSPSFKNVFEAISQLQAVHSKSEFDLINIESLFTAFELSKVLRKFPGRGPEHLDKLVEDLKRVIVVTLEQTVKFPTLGSHVTGHPELTRAVHSLTNTQRGKSVDFAFMTFNYDMVLDYAYWSAGVPIDYALEADTTPESSAPLLKLHGSLNWMRLSDDRILPWRIERYRQTHALRNVNATGTVATLPIGSQIPEYKQWLKEDEKVDDLPVLVPPSWNKADSHRSISSVWARAAKELSEADSIFIVGYSLPITDTFFRQLYALGSVGDVPLKRFWVHNPDPTREGVFKNLLGPGARDRFQFFNETAEAAIKRIIQTLTH